MAQFDAPNAFDYIVNHTGEDKIDYVGHSEGTT